MKSRPASFALFVWMLGGCSCAKAQPARRDEVRATGQSAGDPVIAAAGDIACDPADGNFNGGNGTASGCVMKATSDVLSANPPAAVLLLGDNQYEDGTLAKYLASYDPSWGRVKGITRPAPGNHDYNTPGAAGYYAYFGAAAGDPVKGYYSYEIGAWHLIALNSNCADVPCDAGSLQERWLADDLAAHPGVCTLAYWHHPRFSSGPHGNDPKTDALWNDLHTAGADVVLNGHDHIYERFAPQDPAGVLDSARGVREFVVGTGGKNQTSIVTIAANSQVRNAGAFGVLKMTLHPAGYDWQFVNVAGNPFTDSGSSLCHRAPKPVAFYSVVPCRLADTRIVSGPSGGPAIAANTSRRFPATSRCGIPDVATAVALNVTVVQPTDVGSLRVGAASIAEPLTSTVSFTTSVVRALGTIVSVGVGGEISVRCDMPSGSTGAVQVVLDVAGYFQ